MGIFDSIKNIMTIPEEDEIDNETEVVEEAPKKKPQPKLSVILHPVLSAVRLRMYRQTVCRLCL